MLVQCTNAGLIRDVRGLLLEAGREARLKVIKGSGLAANGADDVPIAAAELLDEREAEASRCSDNQDGWFILSLWLSWLAEVNCQLCRRAASL
jgi:hypothetical protein